MSTISLPNHATLEQMRREARTLQRAVRAGDPRALQLLAQHLGDSPGETAGFALTRAQLVVARAHGFSSWPRLRRYFDLAAGLRFEPARPTSSEPATDRFVRLACLGYSADDGPQRWAAARELLTDQPALLDDVWSAAAAGDADEVLARLTADPGLATRRGGIFQWTPLYYLAYSRVPAPATTETLGRVLLEAGADPNEGYLWAGQPTPFTLLTGALGSGEQGSSRQPPLPLSFARMLLDAGADANDAQALYNRQFEPDNDHLRLLLAYGLGRGDGGPWRRLLGDAVDDPAGLLRGQLSWAVDHGMRERVRLLIEQGVDLAGRDRHGRRPVEAALLTGHPAIADLLTAAGSPPPMLSPADRVLAAVMSGNRAAVDAIRGGAADALDQARRQRPGLAVWAAALNRPDAVAAALDLGWDVNTLSRGDTPVEQPWQTALHEAAGNGSVVLVRLLLTRGADPTIRDRRFAATAADWARHFDRPDIADLIDGSAGPERR